MPLVPILEVPSPVRKVEFLAAVKRSRNLHGRWISAPDTVAKFNAYLRRLSEGSHIAYWVVTETRELAGVIAGRWRDHERWAICVEDWKALARKRNRQAHVSDRGKSGNR